MCRFARLSGRRIRKRYHRGIPLDALSRLHDYYLGENEAHIRLETWDKAVQWATKPLCSTSSLLMPDGKDMYIAFDYLADAIDGVAPARELPLEVWDELISFVPPEDIMEVAWSAFYRNRPLIAETAFGDPELDYQVLGWLELPGMPSDAGSMRCLAIERLTEIVLL